MSTRSLRHLRSRESKGGDEGTERTEFEDQQNDFTTASHYLSTRLGVKRKHGENVITIHSTPKKRRKVDGELQDVYCWECHKECIDGAMDCATCPRTFHSKCVEPQSATLVPDWLCPVCQAITKAECSETRSWAMQLLTPEQLSPLLGFALQRMRHSDSEPFQNPVPATLVPDYYDLIFHPLDLSTLEKNIQKSEYASTEAFLEDAKWIIHNCIVFHGPSSKYCQDARLIEKICKHEMAEIELCPDCYKNSCIRQDKWFGEPCTNPHCLVWAKLKGFPYWPAKALRISKDNANVDVRFFGAHDRAWIPINQVFLLSKESPVVAKNVKKHGLDSAMVELRSHIAAIEKEIGEFQYAPTRTEFKPDHLLNCPLFGGSSMPEGGEDGAARQISPTPSLSSVSCKSEKVGGNRKELLNSSRNSRSRSERRSEEPPREERSVSRNESELSTQDSTPEKGTTQSAPSLAAADSNGIFTLDTEKLESTSLSGAAMDEMNSAEDMSRGKSKSATEGARKSVSKYKEDSPLLERIKITLEGERREENAEESPIQSNGDRNSSPAPPTNAVKKRNLNFLVEKMQQSKADGSVTAVKSICGSPPKKSSVTITHEKMNPPRNRPTARSVVSPNKVTTPEILPRLTNQPGTSNTPKESGEGSSFSKHIEKISGFLTSALEEMWEDARRKDAPAATPPASIVQDKEAKAAKQDLSRLQWLHKSALSSLKQDTKGALSEMKGSFEGEKFRALEELRKTFREERQKVIAETKSKQWCAYCQKEAVFYCCWNTSYCDYPCQQRHWPKHQSFCAQVRQGSSSQGSTGGGGAASHGSSPAAPNLPPDYETLAHNSKNGAGMQGLTYSQGMKSNTSVPVNPGGLPGHILPGRPSPGNQLASLFPQHRSNIALRGAGVFYGNK